MSNKHQYIQKYTKFNTKTKKMPTMKKTYQTPKTLIVELQHQMHLLGASGEGLAECDET